MLRMNSVNFLLLSLLTVSYAQHQVDFQFSHVALQMPENLGRRNVRQNWMIVPHLFEGEYIRINFCLNRSTIIKINSVTYSNDGAVKKISVEQDGVELGRFDTHSDSDWGRLWDKPFKSAYIGETGMLNPGKHELRIKVVKSNDCYGFEPWSMQVSVFTAIDPSKLWCGSDYMLVPKKAYCSLDGGSQSTKEVVTTSTTPPTTTTLPPTYVHVHQQSYTTDCFDKKNVQIQFTTKDIGGTLISLHQESVQSRASQFRNNNPMIQGKLCDSEIWQLGEIDKDNREFSPVYPGKILTINLTGDANEEKRFPMKILPFATKDIIINFEMPPHVRMAQGSAFFALGLFNLTKPADIGMRYYDHVRKNFSDIHVITYTPEYQVMGWNVPNLGKTNDKNNTIHLHFQSEANVIMFDFLKLQYTQRDERQTNSLIARKGHWKVRGLRYSTSVAMTVLVDDKNEAKHIEDAVLMYQVSPFSQYHTALRINNDGTFYPYKSFKITINQSERTFVDVSGFSFKQTNTSSRESRSSGIRSLQVDTSNNVITTFYKDGSILRLRLVATPSDTKLQIINYEMSADQKKNNDAHSIVFTSTYVTDYYAAVNTLAAQGRERPILSNVDGLSGEKKYIFRKTSPTNMFYTNNFITLQFSSK